MIVKEEGTMIISGQAVEEAFAEGLKEEDNLKSAKAKMDEVAEENKKLKLTLSQMMKNYQSLKMSFDGISKQDDHPIRIKDSSPMPDECDDKSELVCRLSLGSFSGEDCKKEEKKSNLENKHLQEIFKVDGLELGLDHKFHLSDSGDVTKNSSSENNSFDESKEEEIEAKGSSRSSKSARSTTSDEILELNPVKKPRVSVRAVCDTQTMNDGCQWRKYGQKISKGNPCPRAYYRCTASTSCPVRKQVQRCADNMAILITTYEGTHNHPLPPSATTMASATTSAAAMLNCGSSTSSPLSQGAFSTSSATASNFNTFNFSSSNSTFTSPYSTFPRASISTSQSHPTVILDLTPPSHTSIPYNKYSTNSSSLYSSTPRSSSTCLNFSLVPPSNSGSLGASKTLFHTESHASPYSHPYVYNKNIQEEVLSSDEIGAAAKAITRDPKFQTALATAVASLLGNGGGVNNVQEAKSGQNLKLGENFGLSFSQPSSRNGVAACATSYLSKYLESLNPQQK